MRWVREGRERKVVELRRVEALAIADVSDIEEIAQGEGGARLVVIDDPLPSDPDHALIRIEPPGDYAKGETRIMRDELLKKFEIVEECLNVVRTRIPEKRRAGNGYRN